MASISASEALIGQADIGQPLGGLWNNKNYSGTFIPTLWSAKLNAKFYAQSTFVAVSNTNWEGEIKNMGDKVVINTPPLINVLDYTVGTQLIYQVPTPEVVELAIDKAKYFAFQCNDVLGLQAKPDLMDTFSTDAGQQLRTKIDTSCWRVALGTADSANRGASAGLVSNYDLGASATPLTLNTGNILQTITAMASVLDEQNVPDDGRWLVLTPYERQILMNSNLAQAQFMGDSQSVLRNGKIGRIDRFDIYLSNLLPKGAANEDWDGNVTGSDPKRHAIFAGHKSAITFASQINKVEQVRNPNDFGDFVRGLAVFGTKTVLATGLTEAIIAG